MRENKRGARRAASEDVNITCDIYMFLYGDGFDEMYGALTK